MPYIYIFKSSKTILSEHQVLILRPEIFGGGGGTLLFYIQHTNSDLG